MSAVGVTVPTFPDGLHCLHGYPPGEMCPACGEIPDPFDHYEEHDVDCGCFDCERESDDFFA